MIVDVPGHLPVVAPVAEANQLLHEVQSGGYTAPWVDSPRETDPSYEGLEPDRVTLGVSETEVRSEAHPPAPGPAEVVTHFENAGHYLVHPVGAEPPHALYGAQVTGYLAQRVEDLQEEQSDDDDEVDDGLDGDEVTLCSAVVSMEPQGYSRRPKRFTGRWGKKRIRHHVIVVPQVAQDLVEADLGALPAPWPSTLRTWRNRSRSVRALSSSMADSTLYAAVFLSPLAIRLVPLRMLARRAATRTARRASGVFQHPSGLRPVPSNWPKSWTTGPL